MNALLEFKDNILFKEDKKFLVLPSRIIKTLGVDDLVILLLENNKITGDRNVFCYDLNKTFKWQVSSPDKLHEVNYFTGIYFNESDFYAYSCSGVEYCIDINTGIIISSELIK